MLITVKNIELTSKTRRSMKKSKDVKKKERRKEEENMVDQTLAGQKSRIYDLCKFDE